MSKFTKKRGKSTPEISTASLPDIIFMLLFFFMVVTVMKDSTLMLRTQIPQATELEKLERKSLVSHIYIGVPLPQHQGVYGTSPRIQLNDQITEVDNIPAFIEGERGLRHETEIPFMVASMKVDKKVTMGIVSDVKEELRRIGQLKVNYSSIRRGDALN